MKKNTFFALLFVLFLVLSSCAHQQTGTSAFEGLSLSEKSAKFINEADCVYYDNGTFELYGETIQNLIPGVDGTFQNLTSALTNLHEFDLSIYEEISKDDVDNTLSTGFYTGIGDARCQVILGGLDPSKSEITISFIFDDGDEFYLKGAYSDELLEVADLKSTALTNADESEGNVKITDISSVGGKSSVIQRGMSTLIIKTLELTIEKTDPIKSSEDSSFDMKIEIIGGDTYLYDSENMCFKLDGADKQQIFSIEGDEKFIQTLKMILK